MNSMAYIYIQIYLTCTCTLTTKYQTRNIQFLGNIFLNTVICMMSKKSTSMYFNVFLFGATIITTYQKKQNFSKKTSNHLCEIQKIVIFFKITRPERRTTKNVKKTGTSFSDRTFQSFNVTQKLNYYTTAQSYHITDHITLIIVTQHKILLIKNQITYTYTPIIVGTLRTYTSQYKYLRIY